jgi:hypothetical protein
MEPRVACPWNTPMRMDCGWAHTAHRTDQHILCLYDVNISDDDILIPLLALLQIIQAYAVM